MLLAPSGTGGRADPDATALIEQARRRARRRRALIAVLVVVTAVAAYAGTARLGDVALPGLASSGGGQSSAVALAARPPAVRLVWQSDSTVAGFVIGDPVDGRTMSIPGPTGGDCLASCLATVGSDVFAGSPAGVYRLGLSGGQPTRVAAGDLVFAAPGVDRLYVATISATAPLGEAVSLLTTSGVRLAGPWPMPAGYLLTDPPRATSMGIAVTTPAPQSTPGSTPLSLWDPRTGTVTPVGDMDGLIDTALRASGDLVAWTRDSGRVGEGTWRYQGRLVAGSYPVSELIVTDTANGASLVVPAPSGSLGFIGGGAFSPDGTKLAAFVQLNHVLGPGLNGQVAELVVVDTATGELQQIHGSRVEYGEAYGFATWSPDSQWVFFGGLTSQQGLSGPSNGILGHLGAYRLNTSRATELSLPADYSTIAAPRPT